MTTASEVAVLVPGSARGSASRTSAAIRERPVIRFASFAALGLYGTLRWATLMTPAPVWRMLGLLVVALGLVAAGNVVDARRRAAVLILTVPAILAAFALAGVPWAWVRHLRIAVTADGISQGLGDLPRVLLPYLGVNQWIRIVMVLGAGLLLFAAALIVALAQRRRGDGTRAVAAVPLITLAVVPATLVHPQLPYLQGLILFLLVAAFMWADRVRHGDLLTAATVATLAGAAAMIAAPGVRAHKPWLNYQAIASGLAAAHPESFDWAQRYGPLHWPRSGKEVLDVQARDADYWKAENLDVFNGRGWAADATQTEDAQYSVDPANTQRWTQTLHVTSRAIKTTNVIAAGVAEVPPAHLAGTVGGVSDGTWIDPPGIAPGDSYDVTTYDPHPTATALSAAGIDYPDALLPGYLSLEVPISRNPAVAGGGSSALPTEQVILPPFGSRVATSYGPSTPDPAAALRNSPYARAYALATRLADQAATPYAYVLGVKRYLDSGSYSYDENPPPSRYPLEAFLFGAKRGYCQQFAGSMALLLRLGGVPARVSAGFTSGIYDKATHTWVVADTDAHAWVEAWFPHYGWVRFDPTPAVAPARGGLLPRVAVKGSTSNGSTKPSSHGVSSAPGVLAGSAHPQRGGFPVAELIAAAALLAVLAIALRLMLRVEEPTGEELLAELERAFARSGRRVPPGTTLARLEQRLRASPGAEAYVRTIRLSRFAGASERPSGAQRRALRRQLSTGLGLLGRLRALWALPPQLCLRRKPTPQRQRGLHSS